MAEYLHSFLKITSQGISSCNPGKSLIVPNFSKDVGIEKPSKNINYVPHSLDILKKIDKNDRFLDLELCKNQIVYKMVK